MTLPAHADTRLTLLSRGLFSFDARDRSLVTRTGHTLAHTRASVASVTDNAGLVVPIVHSIHAWSQRGGAVGLDVMPARTNLLLHNRDLTQAAWVDTDVTVARDLVGVDGEPNTGNRLTATDADGTVLQTVTSASAVRGGSAYVKRITGSGTVEMTVDGGATWTPLTLTTSWARFVLQPQTHADPEVGFRIATSGDVIGVDYVQCENGNTISAPVVTGAAGVARAVDALATTMGTTLPETGSGLVRCHRPAWADLTGTLATGYLLGLSASNPRMALYTIAASRTVRIELVDGAGTAVGAEAAMPAGSVLALAWQWRNLSTGGSVRLDVGSGFGAWSSACAAITALGSGALTLGDAAHTSGVGAATGLCQVRLWPGHKTRAQLVEAV